MKATDRMGESKTAVETEQKDDSVTEHKFDPVAFDAAIANWYGCARDRMLELGFETTDEFMKAIRGR